MAKLQIINGERSKARGLEPAPLTAQDARELVKAINLLERVQSKLHKNIILLKAARAGKKA